MAALLGVGIMVWAGIMTETDAFLFVDWNVMAILVSVWIIAGYFGKSGVPELLSFKAMQWSKGALRVAGDHPLAPGRDPVHRGGTTWW